MTEWKQVSRDYYESINGDKIWRECPLRPTLEETIKEPVRYALKKHGQLYSQIKEYPSLRLAMEAANE